MKTLLDQVIGHAEDSARVCVQLVHSGGRAGGARDGETRTFAQVAQGAAQAAGFLAARGVRRGQVVILIGTHHPDLVASWLGCVWLGAVPSILAEPSVRIDRGVYWSRLTSLLDRVGASLILTEPGVSLEGAPKLTRFTYDEAVAGREPVPEPVVVMADDLLLLQHSSGTTGLQKGVMLSHGAVMRQVSAYAKAVGFAPGDSVASWLPLYHDMGLIACFVTPLALGLKVAWLSPFEWVASPGSLLHAVSRHRSTHVWLPNFAYAFLAQRVRESPGDLSCLKAVINCSEPVTEEAMTAFSARFARDGLSHDALQTCYAMAENVFAVSTSSAMVPPRKVRVDRKSWVERHLATPSQDRDALVHVSNGTVIEGTNVRIASLEAADALPPGEAGRVLIRSDYLFTGYFRRPELTPDLFDGEGFFDTGDLGYLDEVGHLFVTGRRKDLVIIGGKNVYPTDVEAVASEVQGVHPGRAVVFGVPHRGLATEGLVALVESDEPEGAWKDVERRLRSAVPARLDLDLLDARVVAKGALRKSTSGKLARQGNREWYLEGRFGSVPASIDAPKRSSDEG